MKDYIKYIVIFLVVIGVSFGATSFFLKDNQYSFEADTTEGKKRLSDFKGKNVVVYFGYTYCADVCSMSLETVEKAVRNLKDKGVTYDDVLVLFGSLDPDRDTPEALNEYAQYFYPNSLGFKIEKSELPKVAGRFGVKYEIMGMDESAMNYSVAHSSALFFFNKKGKLVNIETNLTEDVVTKAMADFLGVK